MTLRWPSPAKLNLFLHVTGRRADGYHELQTAFQILKFGDELEFTPASNGQIQLECIGLDLNVSDNLVHKAANLLQETSDIDNGINIKLHKSIPTGGGLGGGSSNAATTLVALNHIWQTGYTLQQLAEMGLSLGADVPVFVHGKSAWGEGVGEILTPMDLPPWWYLVVHPGCHVDTGKIFSNPDLTRNTTPITISEFHKGVGQNDCEPVVFQEYPEVAEAAKWLGQWTRAKMTGTGASVFGQFKSEAEARETLKKVPGKWKGFVSQGVNTSPLLDHIINQNY
ncbi:MAG: 4-(cytidine 5'-diphospho)-2-C-methyl-D-erythritol kinase [Gammaproteobacteria bacterium]|nr:4-(cytidine 5'-diphospho)-2-C-methyl-D-erythritol kinase [Gammaproteobacteria bacterium]